MTTAWLFILRKKVRSQTAIISEKVEQERVQEERTRIARELHDTLEQELAGIGLQLDLAKARMQGEEGRAKEPVELALRMLRRCQGETRRSISNLRSTQLEGGDLAKAMRYLVDELKAGTPIHLELEVVGTPQKLPGLVEHNLLRLTQEALTNGLKHSGASRIEIKIRYETLRILIEVKDDGRGFDPLGKETEKEGHFGLQGMKERAAKLGATLKIESEPGKGVCISLELPLRPRKLNGSLVSGV
jgi:signal transduction histidine kinase